jgi:hypothetical protein
VKEEFQMSKYPCGLIEDLIPLYIEGDISEDTKEIVEKHLKDCKNCSALIQEYTNDELNLKELKEDLPQADTFKRWMKKLKLWGLITTAAAIITAMFIGIIGYKIGEKPKNDILTLKTIVKTFEKEGIDLKKDSSKSPEDFEIVGVKPAVFSIGHKKDTLLIYTFKSFVEREDFIKNSNKFKNPFSLLEIPFKAKNVLLVYKTAEAPTTEADMTSLGETVNSISNIVFTHLNDGKEIVYKGQSSSWEGTFTLKYYEHWWQDEKGTLHYDSYHTEYPVIKYKLSDIEAVGPTEFEYKTTHGGGSTTGVYLSKDGYLKLGGGGGNGAMPREDEDVTYTVKWNGKEETFILKAQ